MHHTKIPFSEIPQLSFKDKFYQAQITELKEYIGFIPELNEIGKVIEQREKHDIDRSLLTQFLESEYARISAGEKQKYNINKLKEVKTFTITAAHQPCLLGGPAYYFYKIFSVIHLAQLLNDTYSGYHFVPVFINGGEDHDFAEVNHLNIYGKNIEWYTSQTGSVGRFSTEGLTDVLEQLKPIIKDNKKGQDFVLLWEEALSQSSNYNDFVFRWINAYFKDSGLLVMNMDHPDLKRAFVPYMKKEILTQPSKRLVEDTQNQLSYLGFKPQAHVREINLFYLGDTFRERIIFEDNQYKVNNTSIVFSESEIMNELEVFPYRFSPNVIMRPLYQEIILPNVAFIGGGGEVSYWIERKSQFEYFGVFFPMIIRRNSALIVNNKSKENIEKLGLDTLDFLGLENSIVQKYLDLNTTSSFHLDTYRTQIDKMISEIQNIGLEIDKSLEGYIGKEGHNMVKSLESIESKLIKSIKNKESISLSKISNLHAKLNPHGNLQERTEHFLQFEIESESSLSDYLLQLFNPFDKDYLVIVV